MKPLRIHILGSGTPVPDAHRHGSSYVVEGPSTWPRWPQAEGARRLVLTHQHPKLDRPGQTERAIRDITRHYDGEVVWGRDMMVFEP